MFHEEIFIDCKHGRVIFSLVLRYTGWLNCFLTSNKNTVFMRILHSTVHTGANFQDKCEVLYINDNKLNKNIIVRKLLFSLRLLHENNSSFVI